MRRFGEASGPEDQRIEAVLRRVCPDPTQARYERAAEAIASPSYRAVDAACWRVDPGGAEAELFVKILHADTAAFVDLAADFESAMHAAAMGVAPRPRWHLPDEQAVGLDMLGSGWRTARLSDLQDQALLESVLAAKRRIHAGGNVGRRWDIFEQVEHIAAMASRHDVSLPADTSWMRERIRDAGAAIASAGVDRVPCHNSGESSNIMIGPSARIILVDFDCSGLADPFYDIGILLTEACQFEPEMRAGLEAAFGRQDEAALNRCRTYGAADDLYWGIRGLIMAATSPRRGVEFLKYGEWRLLRCRMFLREARFEERLRRL